MAQADRAGTLHPLSDFCDLEVDSSSLSSEISVGRLKTPTNASLPNLDLHPWPCLINRLLCEWWSLLLRLLIRQSVRLLTKKTPCTVMFVFAQNRVVVETFNQGLTLTPNPL